MEETIRFKLNNKETELVTDPNQDPSLGSEEPLRPDRHKIRMRDRVLRCMYCSDR